MPKKGELSIALDIFRLLNGLTSEQISSIQVIVNRLINENSVLNLSRDRMKAVAQKELSVKSVEHPLYVR
jgi:regulator of replication initiation timing